MGSGADRNVLEMNKHLISSYSDLPLQCSGMLRSARVSAEKCSGNLISSTQTDMDSIMQGASCSMRHAPPTIRCDIFPCDIFTNKCRR